MEVLGEAAAVSAVFTGGDALEASCMLPGDTDRSRVYEAFHESSCGSTHSLSSGVLSKVAVPCSEEQLAVVRHCGSCHTPIELCYQYFGDPTEGKPAVLLIGGLNMQLYAWDEAFCEALVRAGFFVIRFDNRDIGLSTKLEKCGSVIGPRLLLPKGWASLLGERLPYTIEDMAKDALALLDVLHISKAHVFGVSMGGMIAQTMALLAPSRVVTLTSVMSTTNAADLPDPQLWVKLWLLRKPPANCTAEELLQFRVESLRRLLCHALPVDEEYLKQRYVLSLQRSSYGSGLLRQAAAIRRCSGRDTELGRLTIPTLVVHGAQDLLMPPIHGYRTASVIPGAHLLVLKSMGHYFHPAFFGTIISSFVHLVSTMTEDHGSPGMGVQQPLPISRLPEMLRAHEDPISPDEPLLTMASLSSLFSPVVAPVASTVGAAAVASVMTAIPAVRSPAVPEAVLVPLHAVFPSCAPSPADSFAESASVTSCFAQPEGVWSGNLPDALRTADASDTHNESGITAAEAVAAIVEEPIAGAAAIASALMLPTVYEGAASVSSFSQSGTRDRRKRAFCGLPHADPGVSLDNSFSQPSVTLDSSDEGEEGSRRRLEVQPFSDHDVTNAAAQISIFLNSHASVNETMGMTWEG